MSKVVLKLTKAQALVLWSAARYVLELPEEGDGLPASEHGKLLRALEALGKAIDESNE